MKILALEFSAPERSVAVASVAHGNSLNCSEVVDRSVPGTAALGMVQQALTAAQFQREAIEVVAVGLGPGSYTGIRAAIALAQGWQLGRAVSLLGISSAEVVAGRAHSEDVRGPVAVVIDAQRGEFYLGLFELTDDGVTQLEAIKLATKSDVLGAESAGRLLIGPEVTKWFGRGRDISPSAAVLAKLACRRQNYLPGEKLEPIYLRQTSFVKAPPTRIPF